MRILNENFGSEFQWDRALESHFRVKIALRRAHYIYVAIMNDLPIDYLPLGSTRLQPVTLWDDGSIKE